jgi:hypothetical protein
MDRSSVQRRPGRSRPGLLQHPVWIGIRLGPRPGGSDLEGRNGIGPALQEKSKSCGLGDLGRQISSLNFNVGPSRLNQGGRDRVRTGDDNRNTLRGGRGDDSLQALGHRDRGTGGDGDDLINGGRGPDGMSGGGGRDVLFARRGDDRVRGGPGHDVLLGGFGSDTLRGGSSSDWLFDHAGPTRLSTGGGAGSGSGTDRVNVPRRRGRRHRRLRRLPQLRRG